MLGIAAVSDKATGGGGQHTTPRNQAVPDVNSYFVRELGVLRHGYLFLCALALYGCATPVGYSTQPLHRYDKNTTYRVDDREDGFTVTVYYARYQFVPESTAVAMAGKSALVSIAHDVSSARGRAIDQVNEQHIKMSMGRNAFSGVTSWSGTVTVLYKK